METVLNAFRHHRNSHRRKPRAITSKRPCSTPFGIIGIRTYYSWTDPTNTFTCSTPFGIIGIRTGRATCASVATFSAQRLSASSEFAHAFCATLREGVNVLNAFRHHRNSHNAPPRRRGCGLVCAQRLSASSEFALAHSRYLCCAISCAQRLSASSEFALPCTRQSSPISQCAQRLSASSEFALRWFQPSCLRRLPACFRASLRFALTTRSLLLTALLFGLTSAQ